jgi:ABC-type polysaccharide/polyol phosphate export permease
MTVRSGAGGLRSGMGASVPAVVGLRRLFAYRTLLKYLVLKEIKVKSRGTYLGVAWTLINPLFTIVVYFVTFRHIFRVGIPNFLSFFLIGFLMWTFFSRSVTAAATCILANESMVKRSVFPLEILPLTVVLYHLFHHMIAVTIALPLMVMLWSVRFTWNLLWVGVVMVAFAAFTLAIAMWLATTSVFFRDTRDILEVTLPMLFWATPIFYSPEMAPHYLQPVLAANPLANFIGVMRSAILEGRAPSAGQYGVMMLWVSVALASGVSVFMRYRPRFAEEL